MTVRQMLSIPALAILTAATAHAGPTYLTQMRYVEASVDAGNAMPDMERRVSMDFGGFEKSASASMSIPAKASGASAGSADAAISQTSSFLNDGIRASFVGSLTVGDDLAIRPATSFKTVIESTFVLDGPQRYEFLATGGAQGSGVAELTGDATFGGSDVNLMVPAARGLDAIGGEPITGELAGGTYRFTYTLSSTADGGADLQFDNFKTSLLFTPLTPGGTTPAVVPLPSPALAGLGTLGGLALVGRLKRRRA